MWEGILGSVAGSLPGPQHLLSGLGDMWNRQSQEAMNEKNAALQREFAQMGLRWRVADAQAAGIHPLAALGFQGPTASASYQVGDSGPGNWAKELSRDMGQSVSRAAQAAMTMSERSNLAIRDQLQLEHMKLQNDYLRSQISNINNQGLGQNALPGMEVKIPAKNIVGSIGNPAAQAGSSPDYKFIRTGDGGLAIAISDSLQEALENDTFGKVEWNWRNKVAPRVFGTTNLPRPSVKEFPLPPGQLWAFDRWRGNYYPMSDSELVYEKRGGYFNRWK